MNQIIFNLIILCCLFINYCLIKKKKIKIQYALIGCLVFVIISIFGFQYFQKDEEISSFSSNLKNRAVLKYDDNDHRLDIYHYIYLCFARKSDTVSNRNKRLIMENGLRMIAMFLLIINEENQKKVYVSTFGDRGDGISYFNIFPTLQGEWFNKNNGETKTYLKENAGQLVKDTHLNNGDFKLNIDPNGIVTVANNHPAFLQDNGGHWYYMDKDGNL